MTVGSLFSGIGGFDLGLERAGFTIEWQVENNDYCRQVLKKHWPAVPCHYDITTIDWHWIPRVDLVCGGFPCQPFSCAGKQRGAEDDRYLWPEVVRCLSVLKPSWFLGENVPGLLHLGIEQVLADLEALGYETQVLGIPACAVNAPHVRQRLWILSYSNSNRAMGEGRNGMHHNKQWNSEEKIQEWQNIITGSEPAISKDASHAKIKPRIRRSHNGKATKRLSNHVPYWGANPWDESSPKLCGVDDGIPNRIHRTSALGNTIVPEIAEALGRMILEVDKL